MLFRKKICISNNASIPNFLLKGLHRHDVSDYLLSRTFQRRFGEEFPRREVLLGLAASAALIALPIQPARAISPSGVLEIVKGTITCYISSLELLDTYFEVGKHIHGKFNAKNEEGRSQHATIMLCIFDERDEVEKSEGRSFSIPPYRTAEFTFENGPAPEEPGSKQFAVASENDADIVDFEVQE
jgi:hypothetical protein